jgi:hypothetical protein
VAGVDIAGTTDKRPPDTPSVLEAISGDFDFAHDPDGTEPRGLELSGVDLLTECCGGHSEVPGRVCERDHRGILG